MTRRLGPGESLGRYRVERRLGAGAMGEVYLAEDPQIERRVALKTVVVGQGADEASHLKLRLLREAKAAGRLLHPNIVTLFDAGEADGLLYLAFEFVDGMDLARRIESPPPLAVGEILRIAREAADGLEYAHQQGIVHRDIKPSNLLLDGRGRVKIADFGIAKVAGHHTTELTVAGSVVGSPHYLSPEQVRGEELDGRSDLFSLGVVLYEMLSCSRPFRGETITTLVYQILHHDPPPLGRLRENMPPRLDNLVSRLLCKDRDQRWATAAEVVSEIAALERSLSPDFLGAVLFGAGDELDGTHRLPTAVRTGPTVVNPRPPGAAVPPPPPPAGVAVAPPIPPLPAAPGTPSAVPPPAVPPSAFVPAGGTVPGTPPAAGRPGRLLLWVAAALVLALAAAGGLLFLRRSPPSPPFADAGSLPEVRAAGNGRATGTAAGAVSGAASEPGAEPPADPGPPALRENPAAPFAVEAAADVPAGVSPASPPAPERRGGTSATARVEGDDAGEADWRSRAPRGRDPELEPEAAEPQATYRPPQPRDREPSNPFRQPEAAPAPEPEPEPPVAVERPQADRELATGLGLVFRINPEDAFVLIKEDGERRYRNIGQAREWDPKEDGGRVHGLPGPGEYWISLRRDGRREMILHVVATAAGPPQTEIKLTLPGSR